MSLASVGEMCLHGTNRGPAVCTDCTSSRFLPVARGVHASVASMTTPSVQGQVRCATAFWVIIREQASCPARRPCDWTSVRWSDVRMDEGTAINRAMLALVPRPSEVAGRDRHRSQPSMIQRGSSGSGMCSTHATSPRMDQYNIVAEAGSMGTLRWSYEERENGTGQGDRCRRG